MYVGAIVYQKIHSTPYIPYRDQIWLAVDNISEQETEHQIYDPRKSQQM